MAVQNPDQQTGDPIPDARLWEQCAGLALTEDPRADNEIGSSFQEGADNVGQLVRMIGEIGVDENDDGRRIVAPKEIDAFETGAAVTLPGRRNDDGTSFRSDAGRGVGGIVVGYDDPPGRSVAQRLQDEG